MEKAILLIEDDVQLASEILPLFEELNLRVEHVTDGTLGLERGLSGDYVLAILDVILPGTNGLDICRSLRTAKPQLPIMMLTTRGNEVDKVLGLELGADDYMVKPFSVVELVARVRSKLRFVGAFQAAASNEPSALPDDDCLRAGELELDGIRRTATKGGQPVELTRKEFDLLYLLMSAPGRVFSKRELLREVWQVDFDGYEDSVVSMVRRVRVKIGDDGAEPRYIRTVHGLGYSFLEQDHDPDSSSPDE